MLHVWGCSLRVPYRWLCQKLDLSSAFRRACVPAWSAPVSREQPTTSAARMGARRYATTPSDALISRSMANCHLGRGGRCRLLGYEPPVEASEGESAMRSRSGHCERSVREWAMHQGWRGRPVRQEQPRRPGRGAPDAGGAVRLCFGWLTCPAGPRGQTSKSHVRRLDNVRHNDYLMAIFGDCGLRPLRPLERAVLFPS
jgi:hypothetical protein